MRPVVMFPFADEKVKAQRAGFEMRVSIDKEACLVAVYMLPTTDKTKEAFRRAAFEEGATDGQDSMMVVTRYDTPGQVLDTVSMTIRKVWERIGEVL
jgi:hypothetical protein